MVKCIYQKQLKLFISFTLILSFLGLSFRLVRSVRRSTLPAPRPSPRWHGPRAPPPSPPPIPWVLPPPPPSAKSSRCPCQVCAPSTVTELCSLCSDSCAHSCDSWIELFMSDIKSSWLIFMHRLCPSLCSEFVWNESWSYVFIYSFFFFSCICFVLFSGKGNTVLAMLVHSIMNISNMQTNLLWHLIIIHHLKPCMSAVTIWR